ncbi:hypothetical protein Tco_1550138 [Tanacetum coccineum]
MEQVHVWWAQRESGKIKKRSDELGVRAEKRVLTDSERNSWMEVRMKWEDAKKDYGNMLRQKARIRWDVEGDENSKFFHSHVRRRNNKCT